MSSNSHTPVPRCQTLSPPMLGVIPCEYAQDLISLKTRYIVLHNC